MIGKAFLALVVLVVVIGGFIFFSVNDGSGITGNVANTGTSESGKSEIKTFVVTGENFKFVMNGLDNPEMQVNGEIRLELNLSVLLVFTIGLLMGLALLEG